MDITIAGKSYPIRIKLSAGLIYCKKRGIELWQYEEDIGKLDFDKMTIEGVEIMRDLIYSCIKAADENADIIEADIVDECSDPDFLTSFFQEFIDTYPVAKEKGLKKKGKSNMGRNRKNWFRGIGTST